MCRSLFVKSGNFFLQKFEKCWNVSFGQCNVETVSPPGFKGLSCSKVAGFEGGSFKNFSRATFFIFSSTQMVDMYLSVLGLTPLFGDRRGFKPAQLKTKCI